MELMDKLKILTGAAKYDVACTSSGVDRPGAAGNIGRTASSIGSAAGKIGNTVAGGICHSFAADGRCISVSVKRSTPTDTKNDVRECLETVLLDVRLELSNNRAERSIKPFVIGIKNWLFNESANGAEASAFIYSLVEAAKENSIDPYKYLVALLRAEPNSTNSVESLLPWNIHMPV